MNGKHISNMSYGNNYTIDEFGELVFTKQLTEDSGHGYLYDKDGFCYDFEEFPDLYQEYEMLGWISLQKCYKLVGVMWFYK